MSNFEHAAIVAELNGQIDAACNALRATTAAGDSAAARADDGLQTAIEATLGPSIDALNRTLLGVGIPFLIGPEEESLVSAARDVAVARRLYEQAQAAAVSTTAALAHLDDVIGETEAKRRAAVQACVAGDPSGEARKQVVMLAACLFDLRAARADARELASGVESGEALRKLCHATALLERRQAQVLARVVKQHIEHAEAATTAAYAASDRIGDATDRCLGAGAWAKLLAS
ncbi:hypothetical protein [Paraburkholderia sp. Cpub6]|uniref:hypothetical protein n=1 Tax=Paraburkholderia sp. Cpub6 TaxID=2723094 RepID=UPI0016149787|nr:hypothetical protein [Paraburkholderia sp. Cpub6]MBB5463755.1 hypothetical protein [Paraburkholderia sp. Cpub6]